MIKVFSRCFALTKTHSIAGGYWTRSVGPGKKRNTKTWYSKLQGKDWKKREFIPSCGRTSYVFIPLPPCTCCSWQVEYQGATTLLRQLLRGLAPLSQGLRQGAKGTVVFPLPNSGLSFFFWFFKRKTKTCRKYLQGRLKANTLSKTASKYQFFFYPLPRDSEGADSFGTSWRSSCRLERT
jgi:hypothetical protein